MSGSTSSGNPLNDENDVMGQQRKSWLLLNGRGIGVTCNRERTGRASIPKFNGDIRMGALAPVYPQGGNIMTRRATLMLTGMTLLGLAIAALPHVGFAQSTLDTGTWQLNLAKSKYSPGPLPKSLTVNIQGEGQNRKFTGINAEGNPISFGFTRIYDGTSQPRSGANGFDAAAFTRVDAYTFIISRTKAGKLVQTETDVVSQDGKTQTISITGTDANGRQFNNLGVYDKQ
jgi:hypothetical protein